ncbi:hypothetical protein L873DRAFT_1295381 [Choiromyces venosus 120613-1]|nr:hypothetical protein L873DRAFT_1295381 [Choiromyces venosus 120613-1]
MTPGSAAGHGGQQNGGTDTVQSPSESHVAYIPPSLSGAGVTAYQPVNTNPAPGVYVPPPPENIPAWSTAQPDGPKKKFKYTPPVLHPEFGGVPGGSQYPPNSQQQQYQQTQPQYPSSQSQQQAPPPPPPPPPPVTSQQDNWQQQPQQQQQPGQYQQPAQQYEPQAQQQSQQHYEQQSQQQYGQQPQGFEQQAQAPPRTDPYHTNVPPTHPENQYNQKFDHLEQPQSTPTPPPTQAPAASAYHSHFSQLQQQQHQRISSPTPPPPGPQRKNTIPPMTGSSVFSSAPSDISGWEHYGGAADDEVSLVSRPETPEIAEIGGTPTHAPSGYYNEQQGGNTGFVSPPSPPRKVTGLQQSQRPGSVVSGGHAPPGRVMTPQQQQQQWQQQQQQQQPQRIMTPQQHQIHQPLQRIMTPQHQLQQPPQRIMTPQHQQQHTPQLPPNRYQQSETHQWQHQQQTQQHQQQQQPPSQQYEQQQPQRIMTPQQQQQQPPPPQPSSQSTYIEQVPGGWPQDPPPQPPQPPVPLTAQQPTQQNATQQPQYEYQQQHQPPQPPAQQSYEPAQTQQPAAPVQPEDEPNPLDALEQFYADSIHRFIDMIQAEVAATSDEEKLRVFTEFMEKEYFIRGERYPNALGDIPSRQGSVFGGMKNFDGPASTQSAEKSPKISNKDVASDVSVAPLFCGQHHHTPQNQPHPPNIPSPIHEVAYQTPKQDEFNPPERVETYQAFRPGAAPPKPQQPLEDPPVGNDSYKAFNPAVYSPPQQKPTSPASHQHQGYVPFRPNESASPPTKTVTPGNGAHAPYKAPPTKPGSRPASSGSDFVAYDAKRASTIDNRGAQSQSKRSSVIYNQPGRAQTMAPPGHGHPPEFGPPKPAPTVVDTAPYQAYVTSSEKYRSPTRAEAPNFPPEPQEKYPKSSEEYFTPSQSVELDELKLGPTPTPPILGLSTPSTVNALSTVLPANRSHKVPSTAVLDGIKKTIAEVGEDFSFIEKINTAYADALKKRLQKLEEERRVRLEEHEEYTDRLFTHHEIGYGDVNDMDQTFNAEEAEKKAKEEEAEYEKYRDEVFQKVYDKIQEGIKGLMDKYFQTINSLQDAVLGKERWMKIEGLELTDLLEGLILLRGYIERRHEKVQVAILERDRRYRKTVIQPLYASRNISKMKSMEKHFDESEKKT